MEPVRDDDRTRSTQPATRDEAEVLTCLAARAEAQMAGENFPVALRLLPRTPRAALARVYAFARFVDDVGDESPGSPADRLALLDVVDRELHAVWSGAPSGVAPVAGLRPLVDTAAMPLQPFLDLVEANRVDQRRGDYATFDDLLGYCALSAAPVGRVVLRLAGADDAAAVAASDDVCSALQVLEHCQDVAEDARAGRVYLPADDLKAEGVSAEELTAPTTSPALRRVVSIQVQRAERLLEPGRTLVRGLGGWARFAVAGYLAGGEATVAALRHADFDVLTRTVRPSKARTAVVLARRVAGLR